MNTIRKAAFAASALGITVVGAALATAPIAFARPMPVLAYSGCTSAAAPLDQATHGFCADRATEHTGNMSRLTHWGILSAREAI